VRDIVERLRLSGSGSCPEPENAAREDNESVGKTGGDSGQQPTLTAAEREAVEVAAEAYADDHGERFAATLRALLERLG
jgi:hypothetical protein